VCNCNGVFYLGIWRLLVSEAFGTDMEAAGAEDAAAMARIKDSLPTSNLPKQFLLDHFSGEGTHEVWGRAWSFSDALELE